MKSEENSWENIKFESNEKKFDFWGRLRRFSLKDKLMSLLVILIYAALIIGVGILVFTFYAFVIKHFWYIFFGILFIILLRIVIHGVD